MFGIITGAVVDTGLLIDALPAYLCPSPLAPEVIFDQHLVAGISLGGHSAWQTLFADPRVTAGASIIGCPDFQGLMPFRARLSGLAEQHGTTYTSNKDGGGDFLGGADFPPALVAQCATFDPKGICFGTGDVVGLEEGAPPDAEEQARLRAIFDRRVRGKKFLLCSGGLDKLVPCWSSKRFTSFFENAARGWYKDGGVSVDNRVYRWIPHRCSDEMVVDTVKFVCDVVNGADEDGTTENVGSRI